MRHGCDFYMDRYLTLDKGEKIPMEVTLHLLSCSKCRSEARSLLKAERLLKKPLEIPVPIESDTVTTVMKEIDPSYNPREHKVSFRQWIITGIFILLCAVMLTVFAMPENGMVSFLSFGIFALIIVAYCACFIASNLDFFIKKIETVKAK